MDVVTSGGSAATLNNIHCILLFCALSLWTGTCKDYRCFDAPGPSRSMPQWFDLRFNDGSLWWVKIHACLQDQQKVQWSLTEGLKIGFKLWHKRNIALVLACGKEVNFTLYTRSADIPSFSRLSSCYSAYCALLNTSQNCSVSHWIIGPNPTYYR